MLVRGFCRVSTCVVRGIHNQNCATEDFWKSEPDMSREGKRDVNFDSACLQICTCDARSHAGPLASSRISQTCAALSVYMSLQLWFTDSLNTKTQLVLNFFPSQCFQICRMSVWNSERYPDEFQGYLHHFVPPRPCWIRIRAKWKFAPSSGAGFDKKCAWFGSWFGGYCLLSAQVLVACHKPGSRFTVNHGALGTRNSGTCGSYSGRFTRGVLSMETAEGWDGLGGFHCWCQCVPWAPKASWCCAYHSNGDPWNCTRPFSFVLEFPLLM